MPKKDTNVEEDKSSSANNNLDRKHDSGAADLEKVTDFAEEQEILSTGSGLEEALIAIRNKQALKTAEKIARDKQLAKVQINKEDVELIMSEMEMARDKADRRLREHDGDVVAALTTLVSS